ncbi:MAG: ice-binding family protein [Bacteroidia bacterium]
MKHKLLLGFIAAITFFAAPYRSYAQAPPMGTTVNFVLFSSVGAVSNTGISQLTGDVGTNSGSSTAFGNVNGQMHDNDLVSGQCAADLNTAYLALNAAIPTFFPAPLMGNGQILNAGIYSIASPAVLNLSLTLDGQGNPNAVFIIKIQGAFSTNAGAKVHLVNQAKACNVFWKVEGLVSMAAGTTMRGSIIANNAAIMMGAGDTLEGRALSTAGAITIDNTMAYTPIGCGSVLLTGPAAPNLASAGCYGVFTSVGPVTNTATSYVSGDVGSNNGLTTGFNPLFVTGTIHSTPDGSTAACAADLLTAYNYLNTLPYDIELLYPVQFGRGLVLTPHVYRMNSACTFTDTLFLNAENDANAIFVIQINGALTTSTYSRVKLINGTQAKNIFWKVEGAVSIGGLSLFCGTMVSNNGAINIAAGDTIEGRLLSTNGAINLTSFVVKMPPGCPNAPSITAQPGNQTICSGASASFTVTSAGNGLTYQWRKGSVNLVNGGNISGVTTQTLVINPATISDTSSFYNVIISGSYAPVDTSGFAYLKVNPATAITTQPSNQSTCSGSSVSFVVAATGGTLMYQWRIGTVNLSNGGNISGATTATLTINPATAADAAANYNVVVTGSCLPVVTSINAILTINASPAVNPVPNQTVCNNNATAIITFSGGSVGTIYSWTNSTISIGLGANGTGNIPSFTAINSGTTPVVSTITVTPTSGGCTGAATSFTITVDPSPVVTPVSNQSVCNNTPVAAVIFTSTLAGTTYSWANSNTAVGLGANGSGNIASFTGLNPGNTSITSTISVTPSEGGCTGSAINFTITVDPEPVMNPLSNQAVCNNATVPAVVFSSNVAGTTYSWNNTNTSVGLGANGNGNIPSYTGINAGSTPVTATVTVTPMASTCNGASQSFMVTINPTPVAVANSNSPVCTGNAIDLTAQTVTGATYSWTGPAAYTSSVQNPVITPSLAVNAGTYTLTVTESGCNSAPATVSVVVNVCLVTDLSILKTVDNAYPAVGHNVVFTITATNNGPSNASGVAVNDVLQSGYVFVSATATAGSYSPSTGVWTIGNMNNGVSDVLTITATVVADGNYINTAIIYGNETDGDMTNNTWTVSTIPTDFFIPEGFSPNGDGINDLFAIRGLDIYPNNAFGVFNRWGDQVFAASPYANDWDGKSQSGIRVGGNDLPAGTYFYILDLGDGSKVFKGTIYLNK